MTKDGPLAMILWGIGASAGVASFFIRPRVLALSVVAVLTNLIPACSVAALLVLLGRSTLIWH